MNMAVQDRIRSADSMPVEHPEKLVLLVEDDEAASEELSEVLELEGWRTLTARNVAGALAVIENTDVRLVVTDVHLADGSGDGDSGIQLVSRSMAKFAERDLSFIVLSGDVDAVKSSLQTDAVDFLLKPVAPADLINTVNEAARWSGKERKLSEFAEYLIHKTDRDDKAPRPSLAVLNSNETDLQRRSEATAEEKGFVLNYALGSDLLDAEFLPILCFEGEGLIGVEAVPRWSGHSDTDGDMQTFLDNARTMRWADDLETMLRSAAVKALKDNTHEDLKSIVTFRADQVVGSDAVAQLQTQIAAQEVAPDRLIVEIIYEASLDQADSTQLAAQLAPFGARVLRVDGQDFAAACSILTRAAEFDLGWIRMRLDGNTDWDEAHDARAEIRALMAVAHKMGVKMIVDGVNAPEALKWLQDEECDAVQGTAVTGRISHEKLESLLEGTLDLEEVSS